MARCLALVALALILAACGLGRQRGALGGTPGVQPIPATTPLAAGAPPRATAAQAAPAGLQDMGPFVVAAGAVQVENRAAASLVRLEMGDLIRLPLGMSWGAQPGVFINPEYGLAFSGKPAGQQLYVRLLFGGGGAHAARVDNRTYRVDAAGEALLFANDEQIGVDGMAGDHRVQIDPAGYLLLDPAPEPGDEVVNYDTGQGLDVRGLIVLGRLPSAQQSGFGGFFFNVCDLAGCGFTYRNGQVVAPVAGTVRCRDGVEFDFDAGGITILFRDTDNVRKNWPPGLASPTPGACSGSRSVQAGEVIATGFTHYMVHAVSDSGDALSVVVAYDGTIYAGRLMVPPLDGLGRAT